MVSIGGELKRRWRHEKHGLRCATLPDEDVNYNIMFQYQGCKSGQLRQKNYSNQ